MDLVSQCYKIHTITYYTQTMCNNIVMMSKHTGLDWTQTKMFKALRTKRCVSWYQKFCGDKANKTYDMMKSLRSLIALSLYTFSK